MADTTISISKKFHDWLKSKGRKGENYEKIIKRLIKPQFLQGLEGYQGSSSVVKEEYSKPVVRKGIKELVKSGIISLEGKIKPHKGEAIKPQKFKSPKIEKDKPLPKPKIVKKPQKPKSPEVSKTKKLGVLKKFPVKPKISETEEELKQWRIEKNLELQRLETELELAKLSNDIAKIRELTVLIAELKKELSQKR